MQGTNEIDNKILEKLDESERRDGQLSRLVEFYCDLLRMQSEVKSHILVRRLSLAKDLVCDQLREGIPLLLYKAFFPDWQQVKEVFEQVAAWAAKESEEPLADIDALKNIARQTSLLKEVVDLCSRCDAEWLFLRLECPYCGSQKQDSLAYFTDEEESYLYRLYVCEECRTYIKAIDLRRAESEVLLPLERVTTLDMDRQACEKGYLPGWGTVRGSPPRGLMREETGPGGGRQP